MGFRKIHSTQSALIKLTDDIRMGIERKEVILLLQFDFSKAFCTISPSRLLHKFQRLGFSQKSSQWIFSYLCGHSQCIFSKSFLSEVREIKQHFNDEGIFRIVYADAIHVYIRVLIDNLLEGIAFLYHIAGRVALWADQNQLRLNSSKTTTIAFGRPHAMGIFERLKHQGVTLLSGEVIRFEIP